MGLEDLRFAQMEIRHQQQRAGGVPDSAFGQELQAMASPVKRAPAPVPHGAPQARPMADL